MCSACGVPTHQPEAGATGAAAPRKFAALYNKDCRPYLIGTGLAMMADNCETII